MKKFIFFLFLLFIPFFVSAENELIVKSVVPNYDTNQQILVNSPSGMEDFNLTLTDKEQEISYYVTIQNTSDTNVKIDEINLSNPDVEYLEYSYSSLEVDNIIEANSSRIMLLTIKSNDIGELNDTNNFQLELKYSKTNLISGGEINGGGSSSNSPNNPNSGNNNSGNNGNNSNENGNNTDKEEDVKNPNTYSDVVIFFALLISGILLLYFINKKKKKAIIIIIFILGTTLFNCVLADEVVEQDSLTITGLINFGKIPNKTYTIEIDPNGGLFNGVDVPYKALVLYNTKIDLSDVYREYFDFKYWTYNEEIQYMENTIAVVEDIRLEAVWKEHPTYALTINPSGGLYENESTVEIRLHEGEKYELKDPVRTSYLFVAWNENEDEGYLKDDVVTMGKKDIEVSAEWIREEDIVAKIPESNRYYQTIQRALVEVKDGQTVVVLKDVDESFTNEKKVKLDLNGHKVVGKLVNKGDIVIDNGIIENTNGIAVSNTGILTLGVNDKNEDAKPNVYQDSVAIIGTTVGIEQYGTFYFYDGYIEGDVTINGSVHATPVDYATFVDHNGEKDCQKAYLISQNNIDRAVSKTIVNGEIYYFNLQDSINTAKYSGFDIYAVRDFEAAYKLTIDKDVTIVFDINGYNITTGTDVKNNGTFIIRDTSDEKGRIIPAITVVNNGTLNLNDATLETNDTINVITNNGIINATNSVVKAKSGYAVYNNDGTINADENTYFKANSYAFYNNSSKEAKLTSGNYEGIYNTKTLVIDGANVKMSKTDSLTGIYNSGTLTINSGIVDVEIVQNGYGYAYGIQNISVLNMNGGEIKVTHTCVNNVDCSSYQKYAYGIYSSNTGNSNIKTNVSNTSIVSTGEGINHYYGNVDVKNSEIETGSYGLCSRYNNINLYNTDITSSSNAIHMYSSSTSRTLNIIGGTIVADNYGIYSDGEYYYGSYYVTTNIGDVENKTIINSRRTGIYLDEYNQVNIKNAEIISSEANGIYLNTESNTVTLGENNLLVDNNSLIIIGETYGININAGSLNFYDGLVKGKTNAIRGSVTAIPSASIVNTNYELIDNYEYECKFIQSQENFLEVDGVEYNSFDMAIRDIEQEGTIKVIKSVSVGSSVTIPENKIITIDLNGYTLNTSQRFINYGTLIVKDSSVEQTGKIFNNRTNLFYNYSNMTIENGSYEASSSKYIFYNTGVDAILTINNSKLKNSFSSVSYGIYNTAGTVEMNNTDLEVTSTGDDAYGIYNVGLFNVNNSNILVDTSVNSGYYSYGIFNLMTFNMDGGSITSTRSCDATNCNSYKKYAYAVYSSNTGNSNIKTNIDNAKITSSGDGINHYYGNVDVKNSVIETDNYGLYSRYNNISLYNTDITSSSNAIHMYSSSTSRTLNIIGGTIVADNYGIYSDGEYYYGSYYVTTNIGDTNNKTIINSKNTGIYLDEYNRTTINNAEIVSSEANGIYSNSTTNTLTLGENNLTIKNDVPVIVGETYGLNVNAGVVNFYDGILKGKTNAYKGAVTTIPTDMKVASGTEIINDYVFETAYISAVSDLFMNKTTGVKYKQLTDAISEANNGEKIVFLDNVQIYENISVDSSKDIIIDLDGYILNLGAHIFTNDGRLTINNTSEKQSNIIKTGENSSFVNNGNLYINNIDFDQFSSYYIFKNNANANLNIENSNIDSVYGVNNLEGYLFLNNVNINATNTAITNKGNMNIDSGTINGSTYAIYDNGVRESVVKNVSVISSGTALYNTNLSVYNLENVIIKGTLSNNNSLGKISHTIGSVEGYIYNYGTINFTELDISGTTTKTSLWVMISNSGTIIVNDCTITTTRTGNYSYETHSIHNYSNLELNNTMLTIGNLTTSGVDVGVFNEGGNVFLSDSAIKVNNVATAYGVYNYNASSKVVMESGSIIANNATNSYGIYMKDGNVTIGVETEPSDPTYGTSRANVSITDPSIMAVGTTKGIGVKKENGYFNYFDGIITGSTNAKPDITSQVEYNYEVTFYNDSDTGYEYTILEYMK